jgi:predicted protein tyrosine phosphatase
MSQGMAKRLLFVCSVGMLRSPTAAAIAVQQGANARSCGSSSLALIPLSANLIRWADWIVFMNGENYRESKKVFEFTDFFDDFEDKAVIWNVPDHYNYMDDGLVYILETQIAEIV